MGTTAAAATARAARSRVVGNRTARASTSAGRAPAPPPGRSPGSPRTARRGQRRQDETRPPGRSLRGGSRGQKGAGGSAGRGQGSSLPTAPKRLEQVLAGRSRSSPDVRRTRSTSRLRRRRRVRRAGRVGDQGLGVDVLRRGGGRRGQPRPGRRPGCAGHPAIDGPAAASASAGLASTSFWYSATALDVTLAERVLRCGASGRPARRPPPLATPRAGAG